MITKLTALLLAALLGAAPAGHQPSVRPAASAPPVLEDEGGCRRCDHRGVEVCGEHSDELLAMEGCHGCGRLKALMIHENAEKALQAGEIETARAFVQLLVDGTLRIWTPTRQRQICLALCLHLSAW